MDAARIRNATREREVCECVCVCERRVRVCVRASACRTNPIQHPWGRSALIGGTFAIHFTRPDDKCVCVRVGVCVIRGVLAHKNRQKRKRKVSKPASERWMDGEGLQASPVPYM